MEEKIPILTAQVFKKRNASFQRRRTKDAILGGVLERESNNNFLDDARS